MSDTINPYNFIRTGKKVIRTPQSKGDLTGYLECTLKTKTPLIIPDSESVQEDSNEHKTYDYYSYGELDSDGKIIPVIPGSELRGAIRSKYEILTNSCLSIVDDSTKLQGRTHSFLKFAGILNNSNGKKTLYKAKIYNFKKNDKNYIFDYDIKKGILTVKEKNTNAVDQKKKQYRMGNVIYFRSKQEGKRNYITKISDSKEDYKVGYIFAGKYIQTDDKEDKTIFHLKVFEPIKQNEERNCSNVEQLWDDYFEIINNYKESDEYRFQHIDDNTENIPVWYSSDNNGHYVVSSSQNGKIIIKKKLKTILSENKDYLPCSSRDDNKVCRTCDLFGTIGENKQITSRVRFSDAIAINNHKDYSMGYKTLKELASPKVFSFLHYFDLVEPEVKKYKYYNSDFIFDNRGLIKLVEDLRIKGRKEYWHHDYKQAFTNDKNNRNTTQDPLKDGLEFKFKVYFNNIDEKALNELIGSIQLNTNMSHKIGHAKPLGFGSCKITVNHVIKRSINPQSNNIYEVKQEVATKDPIENIFRQYLSNNQLNDIKTMWSDKMIPNVDYPGLEEFGAYDKTLPFASDALNINNQNNSNKGNNNGNNSNFRR